MKTKISVSVIIASLNNAPEIKRCLDSVLKSTLPYFEIIFINDGSIDDTKEVLKEYRGNNKIKIYHFAKNKGICVSRNFGAKKSAGSILFFLDVDTEMPTDCLRIIKDFFEQKPKVGIVQPMLIYARGKKINAAGHFLTFFGFPSEIGVDDNWQKHNQIKTIFAAKGAAIGIRKNLFDKIGGFDEDYTMCVEDTDLCWRARLTGTEIVYLPETRVYHFQKRTSKKAAKEKFFYQGAKNNLSIIIKSASLKTLVWMIPLHTAAWLLISLKFVLQGRLKEAVSVLRGIGWHIFHLKRDLNKRKVARKNASEHELAAQTLFGKANLKEIVLKGTRWFTNV